MLDPVSATPRAILGINGNCTGGLMASGVNYGYGEWMYDGTKWVLRAKVHSQDDDCLEGCDEETEMEHPLH
jgi:hypothetical protein